MNFKTTFVLLILAAIGVSLWMVATARQLTTDTDKPEESPEVTRHNVLEDGPANDDVVFIRFERRDKPTVAFEKVPQDEGETQPAQWMMTEPLECAAETYAASGLATMFIGLQYNRSFKLGEDGAVDATAAGLDSPAAALTIRDAKDAEHTLQIGKRVPLSNDTYVRVKGNDKIFVVSRDFARDIDKKVGEYRAKNLARFSAGDAREMRIEYEGKAYHFSRGDDEEWMLNEPVRAYVLQPKVQALANGLASVRVKEFLEGTPDSLDSYGLAPPYLTISVTTEKQEEIKDEVVEGEPPTTQPVEPKFKTVTNTYALEVGGFADLESETRYIKPADQPWVATATVQQLDKLVPILADLRDPKLTRIKASEATRIDLTSEGATTTLEKTDGRWTGSGDLEQLDRDAVKSLLDTFESIRAIDFVDAPGDPATYGLDVPRASLSVTTAGSVEPVTLNIGADTSSGRNTYVQVAGQQTVMVISAARAAELAVSPISLRSREITSGSPAQITRIEVERGETHYALQRSEKGDKWEMLAPADAPADPESVGALVNDLARLRAKSVVGKDDFDAYGLETPELTISFVMHEPLEGPPAETETQPAAPASKDVEHTLQVSNIEDRTYARIDDSPYVFELDQTVYADFSQELIKRGLFDIKADAVASLSIETDDGLLEFAREGDEWVFAPDKFVKLSQEEVGQFVQELAELRVSAYMAYSDGDLEKYGLDDPIATATMSLADGSTITLKLAHARAGELPRKAAWVERQRVFLLPPEQAQKLTRDLEYYVETDKPAAPAAPRGRPPTP